MDPVGGQRQGQVYQLRHILLAGAAQRQDMFARCREGGRPVPDSLRLFQVEGPDQAAGPGGIEGIMEESIGQLAAEQQIGGVAGLEQGGAGGGDLPVGEERILRIGDDEEVQPEAAELPQCRR